VAKKPPESCVRVRCGKKAAAASMVFSRLAAGLSQRRVAFGRPALFFVSDRPSYLSVMVDGWDVRG